MAGEAKQITDDLSEKIVTASDSMDARTQKLLDDVGGFLQGLVDAQQFDSPSIDDLSVTDISLASPWIAAQKPGRPTNNINEIKNRSAEQPPTDFSVSIDDVSFPGSPLFTATLNQPVIPDAPEYTEQTPADKPAINDPKSLPLDITDDRPSVLAVGEHNVPSPIGVSIPDFEESLPTHDLVPPAQQFVYVEPDFSLTLKDNITTKINNDVVNGGTGLDSSVETAIFDRTKERDKLILDEAVEDTIGEFAGRGFPLPPGVLAEQVARLNIEHINNRTTLSREIQKLQADLAQNNTQFAIASGLNLVQQEFVHSNNVNNRTLQAERSVIEFSIALFETKVADFNLKMERVRIQATKVGALLESERLKLENYRNELLQLDARSKLDNDKIANYMAQLKSFDSKVGLYHEQVGGVDTSINIEKLKLDFYRGQTADYISRVNAENVKFASHVAAVNGELGKVRVFEAQTNAYASQVQGAKVDTDMQIAKLNKNIESEGMRLKAHVAAIDKWRDKVTLAISELGFEAGMYGKDIDAFRTEVAKDTAWAELQLQTAVKGQSLAIANKEVKVEVAKANLQGVLGAANIRLEAAKGIANAHTALTTAVASALIAVMNLEGKGEVVETITS